MSILHVTASLIEFVDKKLLILLRDGKRIIGTLRSYDQFANLILEDSIERVFVKNMFGDIPGGTYLIRGENVVLIGEIDLGKERQTGLSEVSMMEILEAQREEMEIKEERDRLKQKMLLERGFDPTEPEW